MSDLLLRGGRPWGSDGPADVLVRDGCHRADRPGIDPGRRRGARRATADWCCPGSSTRTATSTRRCTAGRGCRTRPATRSRIGSPTSAGAAASWVFRASTRIVALLERMVVSGTSHVRSHTDIDPEVGLRGVEAVREAVQRLDGRIAVAAGRVPAARAAAATPAPPSCSRRRSAGRRDDRRHRPRRHRPRPGPAPGRRLRAGRALRRGHRHPPARRWLARCVGARADRRPDARGRARAGGSTVSHAYGFSQTDAGLPGPPDRAARRSGRDHPHGRRLRLPGAADQAAARGRRQRGVRPRRHLRPLGALRQRRHARARDARRLSQYVPPRRGHRAGARGGDLRGRPALGLERYGLAPGARADLVVVRGAHGGGGRRHAARPRARAQGRRVVARDGRIV